MIITSNLKDDVNNAGYVISRNELAYHDDVFCDDSTLMVLNIIKACGMKKVYIAGFDGFQKDSNNFYDRIFERKVRDDDYDQEIRIQILKNTYSMLDVIFLTPSVCEIAYK